MALPEPGTTQECYSCIPTHHYNISAPTAVCKMHNGHTFHQHHTSHHFNTNLHFKGCSTDRSHAVPGYVHNAMHSWQVIYILVVPVRQLTTGILHYILSLLLAQQLLCIYMP